MSDLFLDQHLTVEFPKLAMSVKLSDNAENWQREVASEIFKQLPFLSDYAVNVILDKVDAQRGYALGAAEVTNQTDSPLPDQPSQSVKVPLVVKDRLLQPLDVMICDGEVWPLNERRLREKLLRTDVFETSTRKPTDQGMVDQLYPPMRTNYGYGNAVATGSGVGGFGKQASARDATIDRLRYQIATASNPEEKRHLKSELAEYKHIKFASAPTLMDQIAPTVSDKQFSAVMEKISEDADTALLVRRNAYVHGALEKLAGVKPPSLEKTAAALVRAIKPTVVQLTKLASGDFKVKWANVNAFSPQEATVDPQTAGAMAGGDVSKMQPGQTMTVSTERAKKETLDEPAAKPITGFGDYLVKNSDTGEVYTGTVLPVVDFEMLPLPLLVFTDGVHYTAQDSIVGLPAGEGGMALQGQGQQPQGDGIFVYTPQAGGAPFCTPPITVSAMTQGPDGMPQVMAETVFGEQLVLHLTPGLLSFEPVGPGEYAVPAEMQWVSLGGEAVHLLKEEDGDPQADAKSLKGEVDIKPTGQGEASLEGAPLLKVARDQRWFIKTAEAEFLLVGMGMTQDEARAALDKAQKVGHIKLAGLKSITPLAEVHEEMTKKAAALLSNYDYDFWSRDTIKIAAVLEDSETADKILSLNFLNPENLSIFASYLPALDECSSKLAEMLMASRLGMSQVPEGAAERALKNVEEVVQGLRALQTKQLI